MDESCDLTSVTVSPDGRFWWDGAQWRPVSDDGCWRWSGTRWLQMEATPPRPEPANDNAGVELLVCFDTTASMSHKIKGLVAQTSTFVREATTRQLNLQWALIAFGELRVDGPMVVRILEESLVVAPEHAGGRCRGGRIWCWSVGGEAVSLELLSQPEIGDVIPEGVLGVVINIGHGLAAVEVERGYVRCGVPFDPYDWSGCG